MCKREVKKRVEDIIKIKMDDSNINIRIHHDDENKSNQPPEPPPENMNKRDSKYLCDLVCIIRKSIMMKIESNVINMKHFTFTIKIDFDKDKSDDDIYDSLDDFFKEIYLKKLSKLEKNIGCATIRYEKNE